MIRVRVPPRFQLVTIDTLDERLFKPVVRYKLAHFHAGVGLLLAGPPGIGKTWAIAALTRHVAEEMAKQQTRFDHEFVTAPDFFEQYGLFDGMTDSTYDEYRSQSFRQTYTTVPWLVLNDLGKEYRGGKMGEQIPHLLGRVLRARSERRLVTHITTNLTIQQFKETYGPSITSLLKESIKACEISGTDRRGSPESLITSLLRSKEQSNGHAAERASVSRVQVKARGGTEDRLVRGGAGKDRRRA